jgi:hypothetical protein
MRHDLPDVYDDRPLRGPRPPRTWPWVVAALIIVAGGAVYWYSRQEKSAKRAPLPPVRVVHGRPGGARRIDGAKINEAEAVLLLRRHFAPRVADQCLATIANGTSGRVYRFTAFNTCDRTRLGQWEVDGWTKAITPRK